MTNAKKEFTREEVEQLADAYSDRPGRIAPMLYAFAARLAEDEASKPVCWVSSTQTVCPDTSMVETSWYDTPLYTRSKQ